MKKIQLLFLMVLIFAVNISFAQKLYDDVNPLAYTHGKRLTIGSSSNPLYPGDFLSAEYQDTANSSFGANLYADYRQWKFTPSYMIAGYSKIGIEFKKTKQSQLLMTSSAETKNLYAQFYGAGSYYLMPNKFYVTGALGLAVNQFKSISRTNQQVFAPSPDIDTLVAPSYLWGALGYGRINNRQVVEVSYDFDEDLQKRGITNSSLDEKTLRKISELLYRHRDGEYQDKYEDDQNVKLFGDVEAVLLNAGYINEKLGAEAAIKLYEILNNTSKKYIFYPKYSGYQVQGQVQYQITNETKNKTHNHYLSLSGVYCLNPVSKTNFVLSAYLAVPLDSMAADLDAPTGIISDQFQNYLAFLPDRNNLDFFKDYTGVGVYGKRYIPGLRTAYGVRADVFHSLSSVSGLQGSLGIGARKFKYLDAKIEFLASLRYDYNIYSSLTAYGKVSVMRETDAFEVTPTTYSASVGFFYRIF